MSRRNNRNVKSKDTKGKGNNRSKFNAKDTVDKSTNDPSWYAADSALMRDAASIPFSWSLGTKLDLGRGYDLGYRDGYSHIPGVCAIKLAPTIGFSNSASDPINVAATSAYSFVRHANSGHSNYDSPDLMTYLLAMSQIYSFVNYLQRAYSVSTLYSQRNRYMPKALLKAMGLELVDIPNNLANFRYWVNVYINKVASLSCPSNMSLFTRYAFLYSNIYSEGVSAKSQLYMYTPAGFWKFDPTHERGSSLKYEAFNPGSLSDLIEYGESLLEALIGNEDINIMSGDILKAYGPDNCLKLASLNEIVPLVPIYDQAVLEQMKNAFCLPITDPSVVQDEDVKFLTSDVRLNLEHPSMSFNSYTTNMNQAENILRRYCDSHIITTESDNPTPELVMEITRMHPAVGDLHIQNMTNGTCEAHSVYCGAVYSDAVVPVEFSVYYFVTVSGETVLESSSFHAFKILGSRVDMDSTDLSRKLADSVYCMNNFKFHPIYWPTIITNTSDEHVVSVRANFTDYDNYAVLSNTDLEKLHQTAVMSQLNVPIVNHVRS